MKDNFHFILTNHLGWVATCATLNRNLSEAFDHMKARNKVMQHPYFDVWFVPLPSDAEYEIDQHKPLVEGIVHLGRFSN